MRALKLFAEKDFGSAQDLLAELLDQGFAADWTRDAQYWSGVSAFAVQQYATARRTLSQFVQAYPDDPRVRRGLWLLALCSARLDDMKGAEDSFTLWSEHVVGGGFE